MAQETVTESATTNAQLSVAGVSKTYRTQRGESTPAVEDVSFDVADGEFVSIVGPSGCGKTTLMKMCAGLVGITSGRVDYAGTGSTVPPGRSGIVFQTPALFPWLSVRRNIALGGRYRRNRDRFDDEHVGELLEILGLSHLAHTPVQELSGGQAQRVSVGRALAVRPDVLLLDEPFSALDPATREDLQQWLRQLTTDLGLTVFLVTHDVAEAMALGDRIGFFAGPRGFRRQWVPSQDGTTAGQILATYRGTDDESGTWEI